MKHLCFLILHVYVYLAGIPFNISLSILKIQIYVVFAYLSILYWFFLFLQNTGYIPVHTVQSIYIIHLYTVYILASKSPSEIFSTPPNVRLGSQVTIQCKPNRDSISQLRTILMIDPSSSIILSAARVVSDEPFRLASKQAGVDATLTSENSLPVISVNLPRASFQHAGKYTCKLGFSDLSQNNAEYNLLVWGVYFFLISNIINAHF